MGWMNNLGQIRVLRSATVWVFPLGITAAALFCSFCLDFPSFVAASTTGLLLNVASHSPPNSRSSLHGSNKSLRKVWLGCGFDSAPSRRRRIVDCLTPPSIVLKPVMLTEVSIGPFAFLHCGLASPRLTYSLVAHRPQGYVADTSSLSVAGLD